MDGGERCVASASTISAACEAAVIGIVSFRTFTSTSCPDSRLLESESASPMSSGPARCFDLALDVGSALVGYTGDTSVGDANAVDIADAVGEACGDPNVACSSGDGSGSGLNVNGAGRFFCILLSRTASSGTSSEARFSLSGTVDSTRRDGTGALEPLRSRPSVESRLGRVVGTGGVSDTEPIVCIEPREKRDIFDATEYREYRYWS